MPEIWMNLDVTLTEVPINKTPLIDDTDFKTREEAVAYNESGMDLKWNFVTPSGLFSQTSVTPTSGGGDYDWTNQGNGMYTVGIPDSGGASINNDTVGFGWFTGYATGILPWTGPVIGFRSATLNNSLIGGSDYLQVDTIQVEGGDATDTIAGALNNLSASDVNSEVQSALATYDAPTDTTLDSALDSAVSTIRGADDDTLKTLSEQIDNVSAGDATSANQTIILSRLSAVMSKDASDPSIGTFDPTTDSLEAIRSRGDAAWSTSGVTGANTVTLTYKVTDEDGDTISDVIVTLKSSGGTTLDKTTTDNNGQVTFALDDGTYYVYSHKLGSYNFTNPETLTVSGDTTDEYYGTAFSPSTPTAADTCTVYGFIVDASGDTISGIRVKAKIDDSQFTSNNQGITTTAITDITDDNGYFELELIQGKDYFLEVNGQEYSDTITVPSTSSYNYALL